MPPRAFGWSWDCRVWPIVLALICASRGPVHTMTRSTVSEASVTLRVPTSRTMTNSPGTSCEPKPLSWWSSGTVTWTVTSSFLVPIPLHPQWSTEDGPSLVQSERLVRSAAVDYHLKWCGTRMAPAAAEAEAYQRHFPIHRPNWSSRHPKRTTHPAWICF